MPMYIFSGIFPLLCLDLDNKQDKSCNFIAIMLSCDIFLQLFVISFPFHYYEVFSPDILVFNRIFRSCKCVYICTSATQVQDTFL